ncbi:MAG TPA: nickel-binding protein [Actinomycetota bacterium]|nr:nickel-binding protein [Actinomycetota bacterium]
MFIGVHERLPHDATAEDVAEAHRAGPEVQQLHGVRYLRSWIDEEAGKLFCLVEAPSAEAAAAVHREAPGLPADRIYQVQEGD